MKLRIVAAAAVTSVAIGFAATVAHAEIVVGVSLGITGPGASLGVHYRNAFQLMGKTLGGEPVRFIILDDASDPTNAAKNARKLISEDKADVLMGSNGVPSAVQMAQAAAEARLPMLLMSPAVVTGDVLRWSFMVPQPTELMMSAVAEQLKAHGVKTVGYIGYTDTWGDLVYNAMQLHAPKYGFKVVTNERYARADTSVTGQVLRLISANPDAVVVGGSGTGGALPHVALVERGYKKGIYHNHGTVNAEFIKVGGKAVAGAVAPTGPIVVPEELPDNFPTKKVSLDFIKRYEATFGAGTRNAFAGYSYDGFLILDAAAPAALKKGKPGTPEFREALRSAIENVKDVVGTHGVYNMSPQNHNGLDERARVLVQVDNGAWHLLKGKGQ